MSIDHIEIVDGYTGETSKNKRAGKGVKTLAVGVGLTTEEWRHIEEDILTNLPGINRHELLCYIVREFVRKWDIGKRPKFKTKMELIPDDEF